MKTLKIVFAAVAVLFLSLSLSGCLDEGSKTASQSGDGALTSSADSGKIKLVLKPGSSLIMMIFSERGIANEHGLAVQKILREKGVVVEEFSVSSDSPDTVFFSIDTGHQGNIALLLDKRYLKFVVVKAHFGEELARWEPSFGDDVKYAG